MYFITGNAGKFREASAFIDGLQQLDIDLTEPQSLDPREVIEFKLLEARKHHTGGFIVEDRSLYLDGLNGFPGPLIKWMLKSVGQQGIYNLCRDIRNMRAHAKTVIGYSDATGHIKYFEGDIGGDIVLPAGEYGFGWDQIFKPDGFEETFGEMGQEFKGKFSMRSLAFKQLREYLDGNILQKLKNTLQ
ncbi:non-canonical purine NTP pyrophosphatase [Candidatus Saccharibacteria bacterium]|nr:MAG: non-canonical purine NTP pyrophosphatase [Candidatus Saccharibacteria bacterium]